MTSIVLLAILLAAAWFDWRSRKIPNFLTIPSLVAGLCVQMYEGTGWLAFTGVVGAFALTVVPVAMKGMGMGDQKLLMAVGAWSSWAELYPLFLSSIVLCMLGIVLYPRTWRRLLANINVMAAGWTAFRQIWLPGLKQSALSLPYAVWLFAAYVLHHYWPIAGDFL